ALDAVRDVVVLAREDERKIPRLVAYLVAHDGQALPDEAQLRAALAQSLPEYMLPNHFAVLDAMPLTANGKVDRKALPAPDMSQGDAKYLAPRTSAEQAVAEVWAELLQVDKVGVHDDFFALGGHSLLATQLMSRLGARFGTDISLRTIFETPVLADLAAIVAPAAAESPETPESPAAPALPAELPAEAFPPSLAQQRLWFLDQLEGPNATYNIPIAFRLEGQLNRPALQAALNDVVRRHDALRACFHDAGGTPVLRLRQCVDLALPFDDLRRSPQQARDAEVAARMLAEAQVPFDLATGPLIRAGLLQLGDQEHLLLLTMHHIVFDGWSIGILVREVGELYASHAAGLPPALPELPMRYVDFAGRQRQWLSGNLLARQLGYWQQRLHGSPTTLSLPADRPRPPVQRQAGASLPYALSADLSARLQALSRRTQSTLFMTLCAAFNVLLARHSGQTDICIGTPIANRNRAEIEGLIGLFVNTLVLRTEVDLGLGFTALLAQVRGHTLDAYANQDLPFEQVVEALQPGRHASHTPLFQVMLALQNAPMTRPEMPGLQMAFVAGPTVTAKFDLTLTLTESADGLHGDFEYSTELFDAATIERLAGHFTRLLQAIVADPGLPVGELDMLGSAERRRMLSEWNDTATAFPGVDPQATQVHRLFEAQVTRTPDSVAVVHEGHSLSYAELNAQANRLARHLMAAGVGPESRVAVCAERGVALVVALLATLKAGGAYVPLDPAYPVERLAYMLQDCAPVAVLTHLTEAARSRLSATLHAPGRLHLDLQADASHWAQAPAVNPDPDATGTAGRRLAYVIYTSGSTGQPKGVMVEHASVVNLIQGHVRLCALSAEDRVLQFASVAFDASVEEIFPALAVGATVVMRPADLMAPDEAFVRFVDDMRITVAELPTAFWQQWAQNDWPERGAGHGTLRLVVVGGEKAERRHLDQWRLGMPAGAGWLNTYGPTEATVYATAWRMDGRLPLPPGEIPIGRPAANTQVYILDGRLQPVPIGVAGEIHIGGAGVARGYLNRPELTAERFIVDPFGRSPNGRLYKTGDLARYLPDGEIEYLGRNDFQVKIRGFRIELGEIEAKLAAVDGIREAVVLAHEAPGGDKRLVAYVVPQAGHAPDGQTLHTELAKALASFMLPSAYVRLDALPLTPNGKVDRKALPVPEMAQGQAAHMPPRTPTEQAIAEVWAELLQIDKVGAQDDFFLLGGHSLLATQLVAKLHARGVDGARLRDLFSHPVLEDLAKFIDSNAMAARHPNLVRIRTRGDATPLFLIHPIGGEVQYAFDLSRHLDQDQPVYALAASGFASGEKPHASIADMARAYLGAIRQVQAAGPYQLAGWSLGGMIAYEMAHQLLAAGETVAFVGMIDSGCPLASGPGEDPREVDECSALLHWVLDLHPEWADASQHPAYDEVTQLASTGQLDAIILVCQRERLLPAQLDAAQVKRIVALYVAGAKAADAYRPPLIAAPVSFYAAARREGEDLTLGWAALLGKRLRVTPIGGSHHTIVKPPHLEKLAREISACLQRHGAGSEPSPAATHILFANK
ncbi:MAG TPA: amino acid adenylation domain-containing protein, partial [Ideonella sp.]|uniref:non-ribosomal peptide synthetase n=1 Tax=Ideonella sp. TaxID=1929293 RepID=UPI002C6FFF99